MKKMKRVLVVVLAVGMMMGTWSIPALASENEDVIEVANDIAGIEEGSMNAENLEDDEAAIGNKVAEIENGAGSEEGVENDEPMETQSGGDEYGNDYAGDDIYESNGGKILESGVCGDNLTWTFSDDGTLTISGNGEMWDYDGSPLDFRTLDCDVVRVIIGNGVTSIGSRAFGYFVSMEEISIPESVTKIGVSAFNNCELLTKVNLPEGVTNIGQEAFFECRRLIEINIPQSVVNIGNYAFYGCTSLKSIRIPDGVTSIGESTFKYCTNLKSIKIPDGVTSIGADAFMYCRGLSEVELSRRLTFIGMNAFAFCNLRKIRIPSLVTTIEDTAFAEDDQGHSLTAVYFEGDAPQLFSGIFSGITANVYYPANNPTWTANELHQTYLGDITWIPWNLYIVEEATDSVYVKGNSDGATIKCTEELGKFISVAVDGMILDSFNYTVVEGSTVLTFLSSYLDTLFVGDHVVTLNYTYDSVDTTLTVLESGTSLNVPDNTNGINTSGNANNALDFAQNGSAQGGAPKTGDHTLMAFWTVIAIIAGGSCLALAWGRNKCFLKNKEKESE